LDVFVSRPTWVASEFESGLSTMLVLLENLGLNARTLGVSDHPSKAPLDEIIDMMATCKGAVVLGYPQLEIQSGILKGEKLSTSLHLGTEWNHLEAGIAYSAGLPLLVIHHTTVTRGIFDRGVLNAFLHSVDLTGSKWAMEPAINGAINHWKKACVEGVPNFSGATKQVAISTDKPRCPNCSTNQKVIYMSPLPAPFSEIAGGEWECSKCKYVE